MEVTVSSSYGTVFTEILVPTQILVAGVCGALVDCIPAGLGGMGIRSAKPPSLGATPYVVWRIHEEFPKWLELIELCCDEAVQSPGLRLVFESELCPVASVVLSQALDSQWLVYDVAVLTVTGVLYSIAINVAKSSKSRLPMRHQRTAERDVRGELMGLQKVTSLTATPELLIAGGESGSILCLSVGSKFEAFGDQSFQLRDGESGLSRLWSLGFRGKPAAPVSCLANRSVSGVSLLFAAYEDGNLKVWDLEQRSRQFTQSISPTLELANSSPKSIWVEDGPVLRQGLQVALHYCGNSSVETRKGVVVVCTLHATQADGGIRLSHLTLRRTFSVCQGSVTSCKILHDRLWVLQKTSRGQYELLSSRLDVGFTLQTCSLQESAVAEQLLTGTGQSCDDLLFALNHFASGSSSEADDSVPNLFLRRLLQPGVRQHGALKDVLRIRRRHLTEFELGSLTIEGLIKEIKASTKSEPSNCRRALKEWTSFCGSYVESWNYNCVPYGLHTDVVTGSVGLIRKNSVSVIRTLALLEQLISKEGTPDIEEFSLPCDWEEAPGDRAVLAALLRCMDVITGHLGQMALGVFHDALLRPQTYALDTLVGAFLLIMDVGYSPLDSARENLAFGVDEMRAKMQLHHQRQRKFSLRISQSLENVGEIAGSWNSLLDVVSKYVQYLVYSAQAALPASTSGAVPLGSVPTKMLAQATSQISWAHFEAARNLLLFLSYLVKVQGQVRLTPGEVARIQLKLVPQVQEGLAINLLLHWLTVSFAEVPPSEDCSLQLSSFQIDASRWEKVRQEKLGAGDVALAEILVSAFLETTQMQDMFQIDALPNPDVLNNCAWRFVGWLLVGESSDPYHLTFSGRAITLSSILLQHGQYGSLESFLNAVDQFSAQQQLSDGIASIDGEWSARLHLLGICGLARANSVFEKSTKEKHIGEAIQCFFRAASGLGEVNKVLQTVFFVPQQHLQGRGATAAWRLQYFEWVMQLFDQYNLSEGACQFAHAALEHVDEAVGASMIDNSENDSNSTIKGRLWANVFKFSLDLELYGNAFCAITSNPDDESKDICLRRMIIVLCDRKASRVLCGNELPYGGLLARVEEELVTKAHNSDVNMKSGLYKLLYALHMHHHNVGRAAGYMYEYAMTVRNQGLSKPHVPSLSLLQEELDALAAAINALLLVERSDEAGSSCIEWHLPMKRQRISADRLPNSGMIHGKEANERKLLDVEQLVKEHALASAKVQLLRANPKSASLGPNVPFSEVVATLLQHDLHDMAFLLVFLCWKDASQKKELENVFKKMAKKCCLVQLQTGSSTLPKHAEGFPLALLQDVSVDDMNETSLVTTDMAPHSRWQTGTAAKNAWQTLKENLEKYWMLHPNIRVVVADTILSVDKYLELPLWLINTFNSRKDSRGANSGMWMADPAALVGVYLDHGRYIEATYLLLDHLQAASRLRVGDITKRKQACGVWFPYTLVDQVLQHLSKIGSSDDMSSNLNRLRLSLQNAVFQHLDVIKKDSDDVRVLAEAPNVNGPWKGFS